MLPKRSIALETNTATTSNDIADGTTNEPSNFSQRGNEPGAQTTQSPSPISIHRSVLECSVTKPAYPQRAKWLGQEGTAVIRLHLNPSGLLTAYEVEKTSGFLELDQAALVAASATRCAPFISNGQPQAVETLLPFSFKLFA